MRAMNQGDGIPVDSSDIKNPNECDICGETEPHVLFSYVTDVCDSCYEEDEGESQ